MHTTLIGIYIGLVTLQVPLTLLKCVLFDMHMRNLCRFVPYRLRFLFLSTWTLDTVRCKCIYLHTSRRHSGNVMDLQIFWLVTESFPTEEV